MSTKPAVAAERLRPMVSLAAGVSTINVPAKTPTASVGPARAVVKRRVNVRSMSVSLLLRPMVFGDESTIARRP